MFKGDLWIKYMVLSRLRNTDSFSSLPSKTKKRFWRVWQGLAMNANELLDWNSDAVGWSQAQQERLWSLSFIQKPTQGSISYQTCNSCTPITSIWRACHFISNIGHISNMCQCMTLLHATTELLIHGFKVSCMNTNQQTISYHMIVTTRKWRNWS